MDTGVLRGFASAARVGLLAGVASRVGVVLDAGSEARAVAPELVAGLEREVAAAGGGDVGRQVVVDRVAYTWFNRITALRFMDAAGITTMKVVSPVPGGVQPEVLTAAKQGVFEEAVPARDRERVTGYLTGVLASPNPDRDAYGVLLAACCRWWNQAMPFLFEKTADYTELLIPQDLLADDSVRDKAVKILTAEVCEDVEVIGWLYQFYISDRKDEVFAGFKKGKKAGAAEIPAATQLFTPHWIVRYLVENSLGRLWLLNHPDSGLRDQMEYYIDPVDEETDYLRIASPEEIKIIDPACGSGHMLTYAFDLLYAIYEEEGYPPSDIPTLILTKNLFGTEIDERAGALAAFALTMKARLKQKTFLTKKVTPNIRVLRNVVFTPDELNQLRHPTHDRADEDQFWNLFEHADTFGSLVIPNETVLATAQAIIDALPEDDLLSNDLKARARTVVDQAVYLSQRYHAVIANPPYMGSGNMSTTLSEFAKSNYPRSKSDLMTMFIERVRLLAVHKGEWGMITLPTWTFLTTSSELRRGLVTESSIRSMILTGRGVFGSDFGAVAFLCSNAPPAPNHRAIYRRLTENNVEVRSNEVIEQHFLDATYGRFEIDQTTFQNIPRHQFAFALPTSLLALFEPGRLLRDDVQIRAGISTGDNSRFIRLWHEVDCSRTTWGRSNNQPWKPHNKRGAYRKWYGNIEHVLKYSEESVRQMQSLPGFRHDGHDVYFATHVSWSEVTSGRPSFRLYPSGMTFGSGSKAITGTTNDLLSVIAYLNSSTAESLLSVLSPGMKTEVGHIAGLPSFDFGPQSDHARSLALEAVELTKTDWDSVETSVDFIGPPFLDFGSTRLKTAIQDASTQERERADQLSVIEREIDNVVTRIVGGPPTESADLARPGRSVRSIEVRVADLLSFAAGCMLGRYSVDRPRLVLADQGDTFETFIERVPNARFLPDRDNVIPIVDGDWFEDDIVARFREWLKVALGAEHLQENWQYIEETLGKSIRQYFVKDFYNDHVKRYKKRPIYWLFSSPKGTFNALIYLHRYTPSTAGTVLHDYALPFLTKLETELGQQEHLTVTADTPRAKAAATKQAEALRKQIVEVRDWATNTLQPLADKQLVIDLDDGVKHNYPRLGNALKKIPGLDTTNE
ncbi:BREX-1 system adenine-specific DNA-methyltransferase PglX (plasmid) [Coraliomargarita sp. W4R53]